MTIPPLVILAVGIITVIGMIIWLRINAFIALITAAIVVSLMAPGAVETKISRVALEFGGFAGAIGIVIALAAVIGQCMMDSGAADRVVRAFLRMLGEKRSSYALMGSGFVLAVPVFFDTVFYLLVPLARSLYRRTGKNYLMYLLAITAGGAITHTLVPPTPGPLVMAATLSVDVGTMILVGALVALPASLAGVFFASALDKRMDVPMRSIGNQPEPEPLEDSELPSLFMSLLPVILPVLMISTNTVLSTLADNERIPQLTQDDVRDWPALQAALTDDADAPTTPASRIRERLPNDVVETLDSASDVPDVKTREAVVAGLNNVLVDKSFYDPRSFEEVLPPEWKVDLLLNAEGDDAPSAERKKELHRIKTANGLIAKGPNSLRKPELERLNRTLLEIAWPEAFQKHTWNSPLREASDVSSLFGNANLALLLSAAVAMFVLLKQRKPTLEELGKTVEFSLMSGGAIILITAAGGAFGGMLKAAEVGDAIQNLFVTEGRDPDGTAFLLLGFGMAVLLKIAQGSSTTAMIVVSGILAPSVAGVDLGFNPVYLCTAIGAGSLIGSWMNDSGFWIFAKMGGLTEVEALKSWTPLLIVLGTISMVFTVILTRVLPLV